MMTLKEAIVHCEEKAEELGQCSCAEEHIQLANWLKELQKFRVEYNTNTSAPHLNEMMIQSELMQNKA